MYLLNFQWSVPIFVAGFVLLSCAPEESSPDGAGGAGEPIRIGVLADRTGS